MRVPTFVVVIVLVLAGIGGATTGGGTTPTPAVSDTSTTGVTTVQQDDGFPAPSGQETPDTDVIVTRIDLAANGSAVWEVRFQTRLQTETEVEEYRSFQSTFQNRTGEFLSAYRDRIESVVANAENRTNREMTARKFTASTTIQQVAPRYGVVTYRFRWDGFARTDGSQLVAGDVFGGGFFIGENDTLVVTTPEEYPIASVDPAPDRLDDRRAVWLGQRSFGDERPRVVAQRVTATPTPTAASTTVTAPSTTTAVPPTTATAAPTTTVTDGGSGGIPLVPALLALVVLVGGGAFAYRSGYFGGRGGASEGGGPDTGGDAAGGTGGTDGSTGDPGGQSGASEATEAGESDNSTEAGGDSTEPDPYEAILAEMRPPYTDEDRVRKALAENGGRMRQSDIADDLDWSASKTSRVLSDMADDGTVEKLRVGRQNVIDLVVDEE